MSDKANILGAVVAALGTFLILIGVGLPFYVIWPYKIINLETQIYPFEIGLFRLVGTILIFIGALTWLWSIWNLIFFGRNMPLPFDMLERIVAVLLEMQLIQ